MKNIELKINKKELDCFNDIKKTIYSLPKIDNNTFRCGKYIIAITDDFIGADTKYSIDFTSLLSILNDYELSINTLENTINNVLYEQNITNKRINRYYKIYLKRGYFYTKFKKIRDFLLDNDFILRTVPWDKTIYEVLSWNRAYMENFGKRIK